jgi:hypothetical protein
MVRLQAELDALEDFLDPPAGRYKSAHAPAGYGDLEFVLHAADGAGVQESDQPRKGQFPIAEKCGGLAVIAFGRDPCAEFERPRKTTDTKIANRFMALSTDESKRYAQAATTWRREPTSN